MAKFSLNPPATFKAKVFIPLAGSAPAEVLCEFKYRNRTELDVFRDGLANMTDPEAVEAVLVGWDLVEEFSAENIERLVVTYPGAGFAILNEYTRQLFGAVGARSLTGG